MWFYCVPVCIHSGEGRINKASQKDRESSFSRTFLIVTVNWSPTTGAKPVDSVSQAFLNSDVHLGDPLGGPLWSLVIFLCFPFPCACHPDSKCRRYSWVACEQKVQLHQMQTGLMFWSAPLPRSPSLWFKIIVSVLQFLCSDKSSCPLVFLDQHFVFDLRQKLDRWINISKQIGFFYYLSPKSDNLELFQEQKLLYLLHLFMVIKVCHLCVIGHRAGNRRRLFVSILVWSSLHHTAIERFFPPLQLATVYKITCC